MAYPETTSYRRIYEIRSIENHAALQAAFSFCQNWRRVSGIQRGFRENLRSGRTTLNRGRTNFAHPPGPLPLNFQRKLWKGEKEGVSGCFVALLCRKTPRNPFSPPLSRGGAGGGVMTTVKCSATSAGVTRRITPYPPFTFSFGCLRGRVTVKTAPLPTSPCAWMLP